MDYTKETILTLWEAFCNKTVSDPEQFITHYDIPSCTIRLHQKASIQIENLEGQYSINVFFGDFIRYKSFPISKVEFETAELQFMDGLKKSEKLVKEQIIFEGKEYLDNMITGLMVTN